MVDEWTWGLCACVCMLQPVLASESALRWAICCRSRILMGYIFSRRICLCVGTEAMKEHAAELDGRLKAESALATAESSLSRVCAVMVATGDTFADQAYCYVSVCVYDSIGAKPARGIGGSSEGIPSFSLLCFFVCWHAFEQNVREKQEFVCV